MVGTTTVKIDNYSTEEGDYTTNDIFSGLVVITERPQNEAILPGIYHCLSACLLGGWWSVGAFALIQLSNMYRQQRGRTNVPETTNYPQNVCWVICDCIKVIMFCEESGEEEVVRTHGISQQ